MRRERDIPGRFHKLYNRLRSIRIPYKIIFFIIGIASTVWFLVRVIPKPSRAGYPCMRAAAPFMSSFVIYLLSIAGSAMLFKRSRRFFQRARYIMAAVAFVGALVLFAFSSNLFPERADAAVQKADPSDFPSNQPMGEELGIFPGRVVWEWDPDATDENCTNTYNDPVRGRDGFFEAKNNDQDVINSMMDNIVMKLTGAYDVGTAWDRLFVDFNKRKGRGEVSYEEGQNIFIKINQGTASWQTESDLTRIENPWNQYYGAAETGPAMAISLLDQLINDFGIPQEYIYIGDPLSHIFQENYEQMVALFPDVKYIDAYRSDLGRTLISKSAEPALIWSDKGNDMPGAVSDYLYSEMENADYLINLAALKAHARAGVTLTAKNHFGSHTRDGAWHLHDGLVCYIDNDVLNPARTEYGVYRVLTDIMGHEKLGGNTVLFIVEGLWGGPEAIEKPVKWDSAPFNGDWPNSIFASQDAVALESVCFDFLRTEFNDPNFSTPGRDRPWYGAVDDHLHQAADADNWPAGFTYDPEGDGSPMGSMGVHEHWNNEADKQYSRNLGYNYGIELIGPKSLVRNAVVTLEAETPPVIDGDPADDCWNEAQWHHIDQTWITWGEEVDSSDFFGRFKVSWSAPQNVLYFLVEITDDAFVDGYVYPDDGYYNFDIIEVFIDEDASGGLHAQDDDPTYGQNSENAFSYHVNVNAPEDGETESSFFAMDLDGGWTRINYADHIPQLTLKKTGNRYYYEFSLAVYDDTYEHTSPEDSRVTLSGNKEIGLSLAYCDNDAPDGERDNFFGSVWVPQEEYNDHWMNADGYGRIRLIKTGINQAVEVTGSIADFEVTELNTDLVVHDNLLDVFNDPDGDVLNFSVTCSEENLIFTVTDNVLIVNASDVFSGEPEVTVMASDGEFSATATFKITSGVNRAVETTGSIADFEITELNTDLVVHDNLLNVFSDPDGDILTYTVSCDEESLTFKVTDNVLTVNASDAFEGEVDVLVTASDGEYNAEVQFKVTSNITGIHSYKAGTELNCFPNPFTDLLHLTLDIASGYTGEVLVQVYDLAGISLISLNMDHVTGGKGTASLDLGGMPAGYYILKVTAGADVHSMVLHKQ